MGTVTAQLMYEVRGPGYLTPDVTARFDTINLTQEAPDRVLVSGIKGSPARTPPRSASTTSLATATP